MRGFIWRFAALFSITYCLWLWVQSKPKVRVAEEDPTNPEKNVVLASPVTEITEIERTPASGMSVDDLPVECSQRIIEFSKTFDQLAGPGAKTMRHEIFKELLNTKVVRDFISDSPCKNLPPKWAWLEGFPGTGWDYCKNLTEATNTGRFSVEQIATGLNTAACVNMLIEYRSAAAYLQYGKLEIDRQNSPDIIRMILATEARLSSNPNLERAESLVKRWLTLSGRSGEGRFELTALAHARAVSKPTPENVALFEQRLREYIAVSDVERLNEQTAQLELALLKADWLGLRIWAGTLSPEDERKSYYLALELARTGHEGKALHILESGSNDVTRRALVEMLKKGRWDVFTSRPIPVLDPQLALIDAPAATAQMLSTHSWFSPPQIEFGPEFAADIPKY